MRRRSSRRRLAREERLDSLERARKRFGLRRRELGEQGCEPLAQRSLRRCQNRRAAWCEPELEAPAVRSGGFSDDEPRALEPGDELRHGGGGDAGPAGELRSGDVGDRSRAQREQLCRRERRVVSREEALDPAPDHGRDPRELRCGLAVGASWVRHS